MTSAYVIKIEPKVLANKPSQVQQNMDFDGEYDWEVDPDTKIDSTDYIKYSDLRTDYIVPIQNSSKSISELETAVQGKLIRFDTAEDLYNFSRDVSFIEQFTTYNPISEMYELNASIDESLVQTLLSLNYVLGRDIDYSVMESRSFDPIAYDFTFQGTSYSNHFTGTFNGQGFEISNLYLSGYDRIVLTDTIGEPIDVPISSYYAMFNYVSGGEIRNFGLIDPNLEILQLNDDLTKLANIVGENNGTIDHVYVVDERESVTEAGIRYRVGNTPIIFQAAGIVHTNNANLSNVYYASKVVVNGNYINKFTLEPIVYTNNSPATTTKIVYDQSRYLLSVTVGSSVFTINSPTHGVGESTSLIKSDQSSLNTGDWYFYPLDGYPILQGMDFLSGYYQIEDAKDLAFFPELIEFISEDYRDASFRLINDIDMSILAAGIYQTPSITFNGQLIGTNDQALDQSDHYYIYNLHQRDYLAINSKVYAGLFSVLGNGSLVKDLNITQSSIVLSNTNQYYSYGLFVGSIAGEMIAGSIEDIYVDVDIDLGDQALGSIRLGGIVGQASGVIERVSNHGNIYVNNHQYQASTLPVDARHYIGGIVGRTSSGKLSLNEVVNRGNIDSFQTDASISLTSGSSLSIHTGGVIGFINNTSVVKHEVVDVTNSGQITIYPISQPTSGTGQQYVGGVIGLGQGNAPILELNDQVMFAGFVNSGSIHYDFDSGAIQVYAAGVMNTNYTQVYELALMKNSGTLNYIITGASESDFNYASLVNDLGSVDFTLTRIYNEANYTYSSSIYSETYGMVSSLNNNDIIIRYSANYGDISFMNVTLNKNLEIFAITGENNVDYYNVHNYGQISVVDINTGVYSLYIAGFSPQLTSEKVLENSINFGDITFADISGSGLIFVGGFVNTNFSGDLEDFTLDAAQPKATKGIINSMNYGNISTTYYVDDVVSNYGINGTNNTFVGGLVTLNKKSIQDSANLGDIAIVNTSSSGVSQFYQRSSSGQPYYDPSQYYGGLIGNYSAGVVAGGVAAMVIDNNSRIYDSSNSGDVSVKTHRFSRVGGILGVSLYQESIAGGLNSTHGLNTSDGTVELSILSNGLNLGDITAITHVIEKYPTSAITRTTTLIVGTQDPNNINVSPSNNPYRLIPYNYSDTNGSGVRLPVYASAGGVIGYGLSFMRNMLNHGTISSTDVAGGVVGATFVLGGSNGFPTTLTYISTAVNYGEIRALYSDTVNVGLSSGSLPTILNSQLIADNFPYMSTNDQNSFLYPSGYSPEGPMSKRGYGGVFGRLQRGNRGIMTPNGTFSNGQQGKFDFIVNANPNIDLIGRLDQVGLDSSGNDFSNTVTAYRFNNAIYYSAKLNDTTQTVFTGFLYEGGTVTDVEFIRTYSTGSWIWRTYYHEYNITVTINSKLLQQGIESSYDSELDESYSNTFIETINTGSSSTDPGSNYNIGDFAPGDVYINSKPIPWITEEPNDPNITDSDSQYMYDENFPMRTNSSLTEYIYYAEEDLLADRFQTGGENPRPNGMYVLSTSAGQTYGAVLPRNIDRNETEILDEGLQPPLDFYGDIDDYRLSLQSIIVDDQLGLTAVDLYNDLRQTTYSDQANLIDDDINQEFIIEESTLSQSILIANEVNNYLGSGVNLGIDYVNNIITLAVSMESFDPNQDVVSYDITKALSSANALIGVRIEDYFMLDDLIISEYIEGSNSNLNNAIEIYNGTGQAVDLSNYSLRIYRSGATTIGTSIALSGTLQDGDTFVIVNDQATQEMRNLADLVIAMRYNGDDAIALAKGSTNIDVFGVIGQDPGAEWTWTGGGSSMNRTLVRDFTTLGPTSSWDSSQWVVYPADTIDYLGNHKDYLEENYYKHMSDLLYEERYNDIVTDPSLKALLTMDLPDTQPTLLTLGYFSVYSEAFYMDSLDETYEFSNSNYYNDYRIDIYFLPDLSQASNTTGITSVSFNGDSNLNITSANNVDLRTNGTVDYNGSLSLNYVDNNDILIPGYDFKDLFTLYYNDDTLVPSTYYSVSTIPTSLSGTYSITFTFSELIRSGDYYFEFSYFPVSTKYRIDFDKGAAPNNQLIDFTYNTEYDSVPQVIGIDFDSFIDINEILGDFTISSQAGPATYLSSTYDIGFMNNLIISPFASVTNAEKTGERFESGYKVHELTYTITSESGSPQVYTHEIYERQTEIESVEKNNNVVSLEDVFATREDDNTTFTIDLGLNQAIDDDGIYFYGDPDQVFDIQIVDDLGSLKTYEGISWYYDEYLHIDVSIETLPGDYYIQIRYYRNLTDFIEFKTSLGSNLKITKLQGTDAYLDDIRFSEFANETNYPELAVYDSPGYGDGGLLNTQYDPQAYFNGFDYDGSRIALERYFRIDGQVSNVPLDDYQPIFDGFIPVGAIVERRDWNGSAWVWVSDLSADFTKDPVTGIEPGPEDDKVTIRYRVVPEDGNVNNIVYYDISVTDVVFNVTFIFDIYYCSEGLEGSCVLAKDSVDFNQQLVIINVQNIITDGNQTFASDDPANYPAFSQVSGLVNKTIQFFYTDSDDYTYRFARNRSYFYNFAIELPKDEYLNDLYDYSIEFEIGLDTYDLNDASDYVPGLQGKYYYIQDSVNLRTRRFNVYIYPIENPSTDKPFGLFDFFRTWGQNNE